MQRRVLFFLALLAVATVAVAVRRAGDVLVIQQPVTEDAYYAARSITLAAPAAGDVVAAARSITIRKRIAGDLLAAAETVTVSAPVGDDVRAAARELRIDAPVAGHVAAAAGTVVVGDGGSVGDWLWAFASEVRIEGHVKGDVDVAAGNLIIAGTVDGDVHDRGGTVSVLGTGHIRGRLDVTSRTEPEIASRARIDGEVRYTPMKPEPVAEAPQVSANGFVIAIGVILLALVPYLLFPRTSLRFAAIGRESPLRSLGLGLAVFAAAPVVIVLLVITRIGALIAVAAFALYLLLLTLAIGAAALLVADQGLHWAGQRRAAAGFYVLALIIAVLVLGVVAMVPYVGIPALFLLFLLSVGAVSTRIWRGLRGHALP